MQAATATPVQIWMHSFNRMALFTLIWGRETGAVHKSNPPTHPVPPEAMAFVLGTPPSLSSSRFFLSEV